MFTGIIEGLGTIFGIQPSGTGKKLVIEADFDLNSVKLGDSISVSGACLTVVDIQGRKFSVDVSPETLARSTFSKAKIGDKVNLERAMRLSDRLDGHLVSGHIDGTGTLLHREIKSNAIGISIGAPSSLCDFMIEKGSVAVDGISLTINSVATDRFEITIIPYTAKLTTIGFKKLGSQVNIETDMIGKYVHKFLSGGQTSDQRQEKSEISMELLAKAGFLNTQY